MAKQQPKKLFFDTKKAIIPHENMKNWLKGLIVISFAIINAGIWYFLQLPQDIPPFTQPFSCLSYDPNYTDFDFNPRKKSDISITQVEEDLKFLEGKTQCIRIYNSLYGMDQIPPIAKKYGMTVIAGAWLDDSQTEEYNEAEFLKAIEIANNNDNVTKLVIGNETRLLKRLQEEELLKYIKRAQKLTETPVGTAEISHVWFLVLDEEIALNSDFIGLHIFPYWEVNYWKGKDLDGAIQFVISAYKNFKYFFPNKEVVLLETGWPSSGFNHGRATSSLVNQARVVRKFASLAAQEGIEYNLIGAFDQPWQQTQEGGRANAHFGIWDTHRNAKFSLTEPVRRFFPKNWLVLIVLSTFLGICFGFNLLSQNKDVQPKIFAIGALLAQLIATIDVMLVESIVREYMIWRSFVWWLVIPTFFIFNWLMLVYVTEFIRVMGQKLKKKLSLADVPLLSSHPKVSIHMACCNEPPEMVIESLKALQKLDYPDFEVIVVDTNSRNASYWLPVKKYIENLPTELNFRFYQKNKHPGFKAGALNYALTKTNAQAEIIGIIDSDYQVDPQWLKRTVGLFSNSHTGVVQVPQAYFYNEENELERIMEYEYRSFFNIGMELRNEDNAIIQHGTMTLVRAPLLQKIKWAEWCICEDAELGLRIMTEGYQLHYINEILGRGYLPANFNEYKVQRFRWAYGAVRILIHHWKLLLGMKPGLTHEQRKHFVEGWLPWVSEGLYPLFIFLLFIGSVLIMFKPMFYPPIVFLVPLFILVGFRMISLATMYHEKVSKKWRNIIAAMMGGASLTPTIARAVWTAIFNKNHPFQRTGKKKFISHYFPQFSLFLAFKSFLVTFFLATAIVILCRYGFFHPESILWAITLVILTIPNGTILYMFYKNYADSVE